MLSDLAQGPPAGHQASGKWVAPVDGEVRVPWGRWVVKPVVGGIGFCCSCL